MVRRSRPRPRPDASLPVAEGGPNPSYATLQHALAALEGPWNDFRRLYCVYYDRCLDIVNERTRWESFTCRQCPVHETISSEVRLREDSMLAHALVGSGDDGS